MEEISISKLSPSVLKRLAKGLPIRLQDGQDVKLIVDKSALKKLKNSFMKGKGITKTFNEREIKENLKMEGKGIFGDRFDKWLDRMGDKTGFRLKKYAYKLGDVMKPVVKTGIAAALTAGAAAATPILAESPAAGLIPALPAAVAAGSYAANEFLDKPSAFGVGSGLYAQGKGLYAQGEGLYAGSGIYATGKGFYDPNGNYHPNRKMLHRHNFNIERNKKVGGSGLYASTNRIKGRGKKLLDQTFTANEAIDFFKKDLPDAIQGKGRKIQSNFGGGQLQRNIPKNENASIGLGGTLLSKREQHPAMVSQPWRERFAWSSTLPVKYQQFHNGLQ